MFDASLFVRRCLCRTCIILILGAILFPLPASAQIDTPEPFKFEISDHTPGELGQTVTVTVSKTAGSLEMLGFDFLIHYNEEALTFLSAEPGALIADGIFGLFAYYMTDSDHYSSEEQTGFVRITGLRVAGPDNNNPPVTGIGEFFKLNFVVSDNSAFECTTEPLRFFWFDCADNSLAVKGELPIITVISDRVIDYYNVPYQDITDPSAEFPTLFGAPEVCIDPLVTNPPERFIEFHNGSVMIWCSEDIENRGDVNLNGVEYEIADYVVFLNYLIYGLEAFTINLEGQTAATDINADGLPLTFNDFIYLIRIIEGAALPYPGAPAARGEFSGVMALIETDTSLIIRTQFEDSVGGLFFSLYAPDLASTDDYTIVEFPPAEHMDVWYNTHNNFLNIVIFNLRDYQDPPDAPATIEGGLIDIAEIVYEGSRPELFRFEACGYLGEEVDVLIAQLPNSPPEIVNYPTMISNNPDGTFYYDFDAYDIDNPQSWIEYQIIKGPGEINSVTGEYSLSSICGDIETSFEVHVCATDGINRCPQDNPDLHATATFDAVYPMAVKGDADYDGSINIIDILYIVAYIYESGAAPQVTDVMDVNNDGIVNILDVIHLIVFNYKNGPGPICD